MEVEAVVRVLQVNLYFSQVILHPAGVQLESELYWKAGCEGSGRCEHQAAADRVGGAGGGEQLQPLGLQLAALAPVIQPSPADQRGRAGEQAGSSSSQE